MSTMPSPRSSDFSLTSVPAFWPMAMAAAMLDEGRELYARNRKFVDEEIKIYDELRPTLATPTSYAWTCEPWRCGTTANPKESRRSSMRLMPAILP